MNDKKKFSFEDNLLIILSSIVMLLNIFLIILASVTNHITIVMYISSCLNTIVFCLITIVLTLTKH